MCIRDRFGIGAGTDQDSLRKMAETARGRYFDATDAGSFLHVMEEALHPTLRYVLLDGAGRKVLEGQFGDTHTVTEGEYTCVYHVDGREVRLPVLISPGEETRLEFPK